MKTAISLSLIFLFAINTNTMLAQSNEIATKMYEIVDQVSAERLETDVKKFRSTNQYIRKQLGEA